MQTTPEAPTVPPAAGALYDIGYRTYEGPRLSRLHASAALFAHSLRAAFGLGRRGRSLVWPWGLLALASLPALFQAAITGITGGGISLVSHLDYLVRVQVVLALFCAGQAPELVSGDQRHSVLPLYFSRGLRRADYALVRLAAMVVAVALVAAAPMVILSAGYLGATDDLRAAASGQAPLVLPVVGAVAVSAAVLGGAALAVASFTPRRGYAAAAIVGLLVLSAPFAAALTAAGSGSLAGYGILLSPVNVVVGVIYALFGEAPGSGSILTHARLSPTAYGAAASVLAAAAVTLLLVRYRRIRT